MAWKGMKGRCLAPCNKDRFKYYTLSISDRWINSFDNFMDDMGKAPSSLHSLDRIDNDRGYYPDNCRWATWEVQAKNRGNFNRVYVYNCRKMVLKDWAKYFDIKYTTLRHKILVQKLSFEDAIKTMI